MYVSPFTLKFTERVIDMKLSEYKSYDELPQFLNAATVASVLGVSPSSGYELMHESGFPTPQIGNRMLGHYDAGFTLRTYTHATRQMQDQAAETMGSFMAQVM